ncbi:sialate O-acetylesterase [Niabella insulamsoli]|uniref:sialate O-acetylesterase n=1 Tax=Niabella insulamsoli TaxID=3144874 RepID=UPI0031FD72E7
MKRRFILWRWILTVACCYGGTCPLTVACIGNSVTYGWVFKDEATNQAAWIDLQDALRNRTDFFTDGATMYSNKAAAVTITDKIYGHIRGGFGGLQLPDLLTDNMVLQRDHPIRIWGKAIPRTRVSVRFMNWEKTAKTGADGRWICTFPASPAVAIPQQMTIETGKQKIQLHNLLIGDVWLCAGQSNMYFPVAQATGADSLLKQVGDVDGLRLFNFQPYAATDNRSWTDQELRKANELDFFSGHWQLNKEKAVAAFSAVGYLFGSRIQSETGVPIGLIEVAVGGSPLISWVSRSALESDGRFAPAFKNWRQSDYIMKWCRERAGMNLKHASSSLQRHPYEPSFNFEAAIKKILPYAIKGIIWYQGESDAENAERYQQLFPLFVTDWRKQWSADLPFYYVQLSSLNRPTWNWFRDTQRRLLQQLDNVGMVVTSDLGDRDDVHYKDKFPVGERLARLALHDTYAKHILYSGPLFRSVKKEGSELLIFFQHDTGLATADGEDLRGFELMTESGTFLKAPARIVNNQIRITIPEDVQIKAIAYAWEPFTRANLVNDAQLPASTFIEYLNEQH